MTKREREIYFNGFVTGMAAQRLGTATGIAMKMLDVWDIEPEPEKGLVPEITAELRASGLIDDE